MSAIDDDQILLLIWDYSHENLESATQVTH